MDELTVLNDALRATGNNELNALNDDTPEWRVASGAYERAIRDLISRHNWPFAQDRWDLAVADSSENPSERFDFAFEVPTDVVHVRAVFYNGVRTGAFEIVGGYLCMDVDSGVTIEAYAMPADRRWHPQATEILTMYVEAGCLRGLNEDFNAADRREAVAEERLLQGRPRVDRQNPAKNAYVSKIALARRTRRNSGASAVDGRTSPTAPPAGSVLLED